MNKDIELIISEIEKVISGKRDVLERILVSVIAGGHILLDDVPGVGKTTIAVALAKTLGIKYNRIQFTPDVLPSDIVGFSVYNKDTGAFDYRPGILMGTNLLLGDEINRTSSKTQSALLEAMEEKQITVDGEAHTLENPFIVIATQNTVGTAGTQQLPYAQMDRFTTCLSIGYPDFKAQMEMLKNRQNANPLDNVCNVISLEKLVAIQKAVDEIHSSEKIHEYITKLTFGTRESEYLELGISPRGALYLDKISKARAYYEGRDFVIPEDVRKSVKDVWAHRIILNDKAELEGLGAADVLTKVINSVKCPD